MKFCIRQLKRTAILFAILLLVLCKSSSAYSQCTFSVNTHIGVLQSIYVPVLITGAVNNDLADPNQGICSVTLNFNMEFIGGLVIELIAPDGTSVVLVGPNGSYNFTNGSTWKVKFIPDATAAAPDAGLGTQWSNADNWGILGNYTGSYHPFLGKLEDYASGPVNGYWRLKITNSSQFYEGNLLGFTIEFCDDDGVHCQFCEANGGFFGDQSFTSCEGDSSLILPVNPQFPGSVPDPAEYGYMYLVSSAGIITDTVMDHDFIKIKPGVYDICGLSYKLDDKALLPTPPTIMQLLINDLTGPAPGFCGSISSDCFKLEVLPNSVPRILIRNICEGDTVTVGTKKYFESGSYTDTLVSASGCDSTVILGLTVIKTDIGLVVSDTIDCFTDSVMIDTIGLNYEPAWAVVTYEWYDESGNFIGSDIPLTVYKPGRYKLQVLADVNGTTCIDSVFARVIQDSTNIAPPKLFGPDSICKGQESWYWISAVVSGSVVDWSAPPGAVITAVSGDSVLVKWNDLDGQLCVHISNKCGEQNNCLDIHVFNNPDVDAGPDDTTCLSNLRLSGSSSFPAFWEAYSSPGIIAFDDPARLDAEAGFTTFGDYVLVLTANNNGCRTRDTVNITYLDLPVFTANIEDSVCLADSARLSFTFGNPGFGYEIEMTIDGTPFTYTNIKEGNQIGIEINKDITVHITGIGYQGLTDCNQVVDTTLSVTVVQPPTATLISLDSVCNKSGAKLATQIDLFDLITGGDNTGTWKFPSAIPVPGTYPVVDFAGITPGNYIFVYTTGNATAPCANVSYPVQIVVFDCNCPSPATKPPGDTVCVNVLQYDLNQLVTGSTDGSWSISSVPSGSNPAYIQDDTLYTFQADLGAYQLLYKLNNVDENICNDTSQQWVVLDQARSAGFATDTITICYGIDSLVNLFGALEFADIGGAWTADAGNPGGTGVFDPIAGTYRTIPGETGLYKYKYVVINTNACPDDSALVYVRVRESDRINAGPDMTLSCELNSVRIGETNPLQTATYSWKEIKENVHIEDPSNPVIPADEPGVYVLTLTNRFTGCIVSDTVTVIRIDNSISGMDLDITQPDCKNNPRGKVTVTRVNGGTGKLLYSIDGISFTSYNTFFNLNPGNYSLTVKDENGCVFRKPVVIDSVQLPLVDLGEDKHIHIGDTLIIEFTSNKTLDQLSAIEWFEKDIPLCDTCINIIVSPPLTTVYQLFITDSTGCKSSDWIYVFVDGEYRFFVPSAFSPDGNGANDFITVYTDPKYKIKVRSFEIFDRWGDRVFGNYDFDPNIESNGWDGNLKGKPMTSAVFVFKITLESPGGKITTHTGDFTLIR